MKSNKQGPSAPQGAFDTVTNGAAVGDGRGKNALAIPPREKRQKMQYHIWKQVSLAISVEPYFNILREAADRMLNDLERGNKTESDLFASDGSLTDLGYNYLEEAFESIRDLPGWSYTLMGLTTVFDKECFTYFKIERAAAKQAEEKHDPKSSGSIGYLHCGDPRLEPWTAASTCEPGHQHSFRPARSTIWLAANPPGSRGRV